MKRATKRLLRLAGQGRVVQVAIELLRAAEPTYSRETLGELLSDVSARSSAAQQAQLCEHAFRLWREGAAFPPYALTVFKVLKEALERSGVELGPELEVCELGPGDSLCLGALVAATGSNYVGVDPWPPALEPELYALAARYFQEEAGVDVSAVLDSSQNPVALSDSIRHAPSMVGLPASSTDLVFSIAVLEHVRDPREILAETLRILRPGGLAYHQIDYEDHRGRGDRAWDFLRFSRAEWANLHAGDLARDYTNRLRHSHWKEIVLDLGFELIEEVVGRKTPPSPVQVHSDLGPLAPDDLEISGSQLLLRRPAK